MSVRDARKAWCVCAPRWPVEVSRNAKSCIRYRTIGLLIRHWFSLLRARRPRRVLCRSRAFAVRCCSCLRSPMGARAHKRALPPPPHAPMHLTIFIIRAHSQPHTICAWRRARRMQHSADGGTRSPAVSAEWIDCVQGPLSAHHGAHHGAHQTWPRCPTAWTGTTGKAGGW